VTDRMLEMFKGRPTAKPPEKAPPPQKAPPEKTAG
jgi:hypothetical protein